MTFQSLFTTVADYLKAPVIVKSTNARKELQEEIEFHLTSSALDHFESGCSESDARELAMDRFGDMNTVLRDCGDVVSAGQLICHRLHLAMTIALLATAGTLIFHQLSGSGNLLAIAPSIAASGYSTESTTGDITGTLTGEDDRAVASAHVMAVVKTWPPNGYRQQSYMATTNADGSFEIEDVYPPDHEYEIQIAAIADGHLLTSDYTNLTTGLQKPYDFKLAKTPPFEIQFQSNNGQPLEGVSAYPTGRIDINGIEHHVYAMGADPIIRISNDEGRLAMPHFLPGEKATVSVKLPDGQWQRHQLVVPELDNVYVMRPQSTNFNDSANF